MVPGRSTNFIGRSALQGSPVYNTEYNVVYK